LVAFRPVFLSEAFDCIGELDVPVKHLIAAGSKVLWERVYEAGNWLVFGFAMLLFATCVVALLHLGIQEMLPHRPRRAKRKRRKHRQWST
jgi:hypothetical protein